MFDTQDPFFNHPVVVALLERLADLVAMRVRTEADGSYYTTKDNPLRSARALRDAARRGDFPSYKLAGLITAKKADVEAWVESRKQRPSAKRMNPTCDNQGMLAEFGLRAGQHGTTVKGRV